ncbi:alpha/beta hydrolase [Thermoanaerobacteraceae bacterium SP2]|nr:alpha/beta hydrolase [Thermoanaerobacteraceae bacterium SP2]
MVQGTKDAVVNPEHTKELYETTPGPKRLIYIEDDDHVFTYKLAQAIEVTIEWFKNIYNIQFAPL